jgi:hypothetical protein
MPPEQPRRPLASMAPCGPSISKATPCFLPYDARPRLLNSAVQSSPTFIFLCYQRRFPTTWHARRSSITSCPYPRGLAPLHCLGVRARRFFMPLWVSRPGQCTKAPAVSPLPRVFSRIFFTTTYCQGPTPLLLLLAARALPASTRSINFGIDYYYYYTTIIWIMKHFEEHLGPRPLSPLLLVEATTSSFSRFD